MVSQLQDIRKSLKLSTSELAIRLQAEACEKACKAKKKIEAGVGTKLTGPRRVIKVQTC